jgi:hypothetical protein
MTASRDRASVVARSLLHTVAHHLLYDGAALQVQMAEQLHDEFADIAHQTLSEIRREDE